MRVQIGDHIAGPWHALTGETLRTAPAGGPRRDRTAKTSTMKSALTTRHSAAVVPGAPTPRMKATSAATAAAPLSSNASAPYRKVSDA